MARIKFTSVIFLVVMCLVTMASFGTEPKPNACIACHHVLGGKYGLAVKHWRSSMHSKVNVACTACHGGNANVQVGNPYSLTNQQYADLRARAMSPDHGFIAIPTGKTMFHICSSCHKPTVDRYAQSIMGQAYLTGKGGPSCTMCHDAHKDNIPNRSVVCGRCHTDTSGFDQIDPMNVTQSTINQLSRIRVALALTKVVGQPPSVTRKLPEDLGSFEIGLTAFGAVLILFLVGYTVYRALERNG